MYEQENIDLEKFKVDQHYRKQVISQLVRGPATQSLDKALMLAQHHEISRLEVSGHNSDFNRILIVPRS